MRGQRWRICASAPPARPTTVWLVINGIFRGLGDAAHALLWALMFRDERHLDPILIFPLGMGAAGAAAGTVISQTIALVPMVLALHRKLYGRGKGVPPLSLFLPSGGFDAVKGVLKQYIAAGGLVLLRTIGKISAYSVCAREAARLGAVASAAHNLCFQLGVATTQICEALAIAMQTLLARELGRAKAEAEEEEGGREGSQGLQRACAHCAAHCQARAGGGMITASSSPSPPSQPSQCGLRPHNQPRSARGGGGGLAAGSAVPRALRGLAYPVNGA